MPTVVQFRRGTTAQNNNFLGANGEISVDTSLNVLRVADAVTLGGFAMVGQNCVQTIANKTYTGTSLSVTGNVTGSYIFGNGSQLTGIDATQISSGTSNLKVTTSGGNISASVGGTSNVAVWTTTGQFVTGLVSVTGNIIGSNLLISGAIQDSGQLDIQTTASNSNIVLTPNGTGNVNITSNIMPTSSNATANIGSATSSWNTVFAKATSAQYADLAEMYVADTAYAPGTVVEFGGDREITTTTSTHSTQVAGIISTQPAYLMNATQAGEHPLEVALVGRVPCSVIGTVRKGDRLVSSDRPGVAQALDINLYQPGCIVGKALQEYNSTEPGVIEVAVGRS